MKVGTHTKSTLVGWVDQLTGVGVKLGVPALILLTAFLLITVYGGHLRDTAKMTHDQRLYLLQSVQLATRAIVIAAIVAVASLIFRFTKDEVVGQALSLVGAVLYFGGPAIFAMTAQGIPLKGNVPFAMIVNAFRTVGAIALLPGVFLVLRDAILRIWTGVSLKRVLEKRWGDEEELRKRHKPRFYGNCWDMMFCREFVRKVCPAFEARKSCWRVKVGCYCDEKTILRALTAGSQENEHVRGIMDSLGLSNKRQSHISGKLKRERCRRCGIYSEHQRQKYRLLSPMVFPAVGLALYAFYGQIATYTGAAIEKTNQFMSFLVLKPTAAQQSFSDQGFLTVLAIAWLTIIAVSYALRALEYLVFELQV